MAPAPCIDLAAATKRYGPRPVLDAVSLTVAQGAFVSVLGESGCGKTTLLRVLAGLEPLNSGRLALFGEPATDGPRLLLAPHRRSLGFLFQDLALWPHLTVRQHLAFGLEVRRMDRIPERTADMLGLLAIEDLAGRYPQQLSGGQQQLVALGRSLVVNPKLLLMDEPLANLDVRRKSHIRNLIKTIATQRQLTVVYVTHDHREAFALSDRIAVMERGQIIEEGSPDELRCSANPLVRAFIEPDG